MGTPTQVRHPWRSTVRTAFQAFVGLAVLMPYLVDAAGVDETLPGVAGALAVSTAVSRIMALPQVEEFLARFLPWLSTGVESE